MDAILKEIPVWAYIVFAIAILGFVGLLIKLIFWLGKRWADSISKSIDENFKELETKFVGWESKLDAWTKRIELTGLTVEAMQQTLIELFDGEFSELMDKKVVLLRENAKFVRASNQ